MPTIDFSKYKVAPQVSTPTGGAQIDFSKYKTTPAGQTPPAPVAPPQTLMQKLGGIGSKVASFEPNVATEAMKAGTRTVLGAGNMGLGIENTLNAATGGRITGKTPVGGVFDPNSAEGAMAQKTAARSPGAAGIVGSGIEGGAELLAAGPDDVIKGAADLATGAAKQGTRLATKLALGKEGVDTLAKLSDKETQKFINGKSFSETAQNTQAALKDFENKSRAKLQAVKDAIPKNIQVEPSKILSKVNDAVLNSIGNRSAYKGVSEDIANSVRTNVKFPDANRMFSNTDDLIHSGILNDEEAKKVDGMLNVVKNWKDTSARGVLNLKEGLDSFYKEGLGNSNSILRGIQGSLKDIVGDAHSAIKPALKEASDNIEKATDFKRQLGKDAVSTETKLGTIARGLKNPAANASKINLLKSVESATGKSIMPEIQGYSKYLDLIKNGADQIPTKAGTVLKQVGTRTGIAGGLLAGGAELKKLLGL